MSAPKNRTLKLSVLEGCLHAVMLGTCESYLGAFAVELGHGPHALAQLATLPVLIGSISQLFSLPSMVLVGGRKRLVILGAGLQALSILGFAVLAWLGDPRFWPLLAVKVIFWLSGNVTAPAWGDWIGELTKDISRPRYFGIRSACTNVSLLVSFLATGLYIHQHGLSPLRAFAVVFLVGAFARSCSAVTLTAHHDIEDVQPAGGILSRAKDVLHLASWRVPAYLAALMFGAHVAIPFFVPYMLRDLGLDYFWFAGLSAISILTKALVFPFAHRVAARLSLRSLLGISGFGVACVPLVWAFATDLYGLVAVHILSGIAWAGLEYTSFQLLLDAAPARLRAEFLAIANSVSGLAQLIGSVLGAALLSSELLGYRDVFVASAVLRALPLVLLLYVLPTWIVPKSWAKAIYTRLLSVRPAAGPSLRPIFTEDPVKPVAADERRKP